ncbi:MAG: MoxR family ATPase [Candidatus Thermoplasmatota archaeon]|nr:MoxR family ATPase [Candidatus Thermoplasmatota archaeon]
MDTAQVREISEQILDEIEKSVIGKKNVLTAMLTAIFASGHILIEDLPGLAKTLIARNLSAAVGCNFRRIQFTPDLLPSDVTGANIFDRRTGEFRLRKGPLFTNMLLADEINRAPPKTQAALLEAMQEGQATIEGETHVIEPPFIVIATQNPIEYEGTYPLPEAQLDRFMVRIAVGYPGRAEEAEILRRRRERRREEQCAEEVIDRETLLEIQKTTETIHVSDDVQDYIVDIIRSTRNHRSVETGASPRGTLALMRLSMASACMKGRDFVIPDDVKEFAVFALAHRIILKPDPWLRGMKAESIISEVLEKTAVPRME